MIRLAAAICSEACGEIFAKERKTRADLSANYRLLAGEGTCQSGELFDQRVERGLLKSFLCLATI